MAMESWLRKIGICALLKMPSISITRSPHHLKTGSPVYAWMTNSESLSDFWSDPTSTGASKASFVHRASESAISRSIWWPSWCLLWLDLWRFLLKPVGKASVAFLDLLPMIRLPISPGELSRLALERREPQLYALPGSFDFRTFLDLTLDRPRPLATEIGKSNEAIDRSEQ